MNDEQEPPSGDPQDFWPTQEMGTSAGQPGQHGWGQPSQPAGPAVPPPPSQPQQPRHGRAVSWGAGLALAALLAGGGFAAAELTGGSSAVSSGPTGEAATLNTMLSSASAGTLMTASTATPCLNRAAKLRAAGHPFAAKAVLRLCRHPLLRLRLLGGEYGQFTFSAKTGSRTIAFERGVIESVSSSDVVVRAKDGTTWTWVLESNTVTRQGGQRSSTSALSDGEHVFAGGPVASGGYDARVIVIMANPPTSPASGS
jgi:hypothetical protein